MIKYKNNVFLTSDGCMMFLLAVNLQTILALVVSPNKFTLVVTKTVNGDTHSQTQHRFCDE